MTPILLPLREPFSTISHLVWLLMAFPATVWLARLASGDDRKRVGVLIYGLTLGFCMAASTLYHACAGPPAWIARFTLLDYVGIYLLIAGTYTPIACSSLHERRAARGLIWVWSYAAVGVGLNLTVGEMPLLVSTVLYIGMGWSAALGGLDMARQFGADRFGWLVLGGVLYSLGATINVLGWPVVFPSWFPAHGLFHVLVMLASLAHFVFLTRILRDETSVSPDVSQFSRADEDDGERSDPGHPPIPHAAKLAMSRSGRVSKPR